MFDKVIKNKAEIYLAQLKPCSNCESEDLAWCGISVRPYCKDCNTWGYTNHGSPKDAINSWNKRYQQHLRDQEAADLLEQVERGYVTVSPNLISGKDHGGNTPENEIQQLIIEIEDRCTRLRELLNT